MLIWALALVLTPFILVVTAYYAYFHEGKILKVVVKLVAVLIGYLVITALAFEPEYVLFIIVGSTGGGVELDYQGLVIYSSITIAYAGICYLLICLVKGCLIKPWKLFVGLGNKYISIFESKNVRWKFYKNV